MAKKLKDLSRYFQVILITHLPQIAVNADKHFYIEKEFSDEKTFAKVKEINGNEKVREIARMLSGIVNEKSIKFAQELISEVD
jgi:DNA repair protein RecN (Recombination protein N)